MDWTEIVITAMTTVLGGGVGVLATLRSAKRKAEAEAKVAETEAREACDKVWAARLDQMREEVDYERQRNIDLDKQHKIEIDYERARNKELIVRNDDKERRFAEQTNRLRETQDREMQALKKIAELIKTLGEKEVERVRYRCEDDACPFRRPPNAYTPPPPGVGRDQWHMEKHQNNEQ